MSLQTQGPRHEEERQDQEGERLEALGRVEGVVPGLSVALADFLAARCEFSGVIKSPLSGHACMYPL